MAFIPLHKGADGFMSDEDFKTFYWPTLKAVILGLVREGIVPFLFVEGGYNQRLDVIVDPDIPAGTTFWLFDKTDLKEVKRRFGGWAAFGGNVPVSLCRPALRQRSRTMSNACWMTSPVTAASCYHRARCLTTPRPENLHAMIDAGREYGAYR